MKKEYAQALAHMSEQEDSNSLVLFEKLIEHLKRTGRMKLLPLIHSELTKQEQYKKRKHMTIEFTSEKSRDEAQKYSEQHIKVPYTLVHNEALISGWRAYTEGFLIDHSGKGALTQIYRSITN
jgi:F0F1-type ATP synthase delta subunit